LLPKIKKLPIKVCWKWAEGHQDDDHSSLLDEWALVNIMADQLAKAFWNHLNQTEHTPTPLRLGDEAWAIHFHGRKLNQIDKTALYHSIRDPTAKAYCIRRGHLQVSDIPNIDWALINDAFKSLTTPKKRRTTKHAAGHFGCGKNMKLWCFQDHAECPRCPEQNEDPPHILCCPVPSACSSWITALAKLKSWMTKSHTMPKLTKAILRSLWVWPTALHGRPLRQSTTTRYMASAVLF
jgi:hypothetical protein